MSGQVTLSIEYSKWTVSATVTEIDDNTLSKFAYNTYIGTSFFHTCTYFGTDSAMTMFPLRSYKTFLIHSRTTVTKHSSQGIDDINE